MGPRRGSRLAPTHHHVSGRRLTSPPHGGDRPGQPAATERPDRRVGYGLVQQSPVIRRGARRLPAGAGKDDPPDDMQPDVLELPRGVGRFLVALTFVGSCIGLAVVVRHSAGPVLPVRHVGLPRREPPARAQGLRAARSLVDRRAHGLRLLRCPRSLHLTGPERPGVARPAVPARARAAVLHPHQRALRGRDRPRRPRLHVAPALHPGPDWPGAMPTSSCRACSGSRWRCWR